MAVRKGIESEIKILLHSHTGYKLSEQAWQGLQGCLLGGGTHEVPGNMSADLEEY